MLHFGAVVDNDIESGRIRLYRRVHAAEEIVGLVLGDGRLARERAS